MSLESEVFKRRVFLPDKLLSFGFSKADGGFTLLRSFLDGFTARLFISDEGKIEGKVFDDATSEEYAVFRLEGAEGAFVTSVKNAYLSFLSDISEKTTFERLYISDQTNRISEAFFDLFGAKPEFMWEKFPRYGVYRNADTRKWFAIIMNLSAAKVTPDAEERGLLGEIEVVNFNLGDRVAEFVQKGAFPSYHMSKKNWVTVVLNGSLPDDLVLEMAGISFERSKNKKK